MFEMEMEEDDGFHAPTREADATELRALRTRANRPTNELLSKRAPTALLPLQTMPALEAPATMPRGSKPVMYPTYRGRSSSWMLLVLLAVATMAGAYLLAR